MILTKFNTVGGGKNARQSNLELLRIVSMLLVLLIHYVPSRTLPSLEALRIDWVDTILNLELRALSFVCVNCFILISGYFGIRWKWRSFSNLIFQILFWGIVAYAVARWFGWHSHGINQFVHEELGFIAGRWFIPAYLTLYIVAPLLNAFIDSVDRRQLGRYIILFYLFSTVYGYFMHSAEFNEGMSMISLIGLYLIGAYLKRYPVFAVQRSALWYFSAYIILGLLLVLGNILLIMMGISVSPFGYLNPVIIVQSACLFMCFKTMRMGNVPIVNYVAASAFAVYLFHIHPCIYAKYQWTCHYINEEMAFPLIGVLALFIGIFVFCVIVDRIRIHMFGLLSKIVIIENNKSVNI